MGACGLESGSLVERDFRDSAGGLIFSGTNDIQRNLIAQHLRLT
jgi:alkylation response protein AidB-like acyl-CoA dehydrogenase